jgi:hypothetical protein
MHDLYGCPDSDYDGYADPGFEGASPALVDRCPDELGYASRGTYIGCPDRDRDGWADVEDDLPDDGQYWLDSDGDGVADEEDDYPNNGRFSDQGEVDVLFCGGFCFSLLFVVGYVLKIKDRPTPQSAVTLEQKVWVNEEEPVVEDNSPPPSMVVGHLDDDEVF